MNVMLLQEKDFLRHHVGALNRGISLLFSHPGHHLKKVKANNLGIVLNTGVKHAAREPKPSYQKVQSGPTEKIKQSVFIFS